MRRIHLLYAGWLKNLSWFQVVRPDHVRVESSRCCFPRERHVFLQSEQTFKLGCKTTQYYYANCRVNHWLILHLAVTCPRLSPPSNGELLGCNTTEMLYKTVCSFSCNEGFEAKGSVVRRCTENGTWSGTYLVCEGINKNGSTLKPAGRKPNALLEILGERSDTPMHACF